MKCPQCNNEAIWCENKEVYGRNYGKSYMIWLCKPCGAYVGCHNNTKNPKGSMANKEMREWRIKVHAILDPLWQSGKYSRGVVYARLKDAMGKEVHVGEADVEMCKELIKTIPLIFTKKREYET